MPDTSASSGIHQRICFCAEKQNKGESCVTWQSVGVWWETLVIVDTGCSSWKEAPGNDEMYSERHKKPLICHDHKVTLRLESVHCCDVSGKDEARSAQVRLSHGWHTHTQRKTTPRTTYHSKTTYGPLKESKSGSFKLTNTVGNRRGDWSKSDWWVTARLGGMNVSQVWDELGLSVQGESSAGGNRHRSRIPGGPGKKKNKHQQGWDEGANINWRFIGELMLRGLSSCTDCEWLQIETEIFACIGPFFF